MTNQIATSAQIAPAMELADAELDTVAGGIIFENCMVSSIIATTNSKLQVDGSVKVATKA